ncbi:MAG TPA: TetR/AcrR family transcriptional regulator [Gemmatimonadaceae bacterium]
MNIRSFNLTTQGRFRTPRSAAANQAIRAETEALIVEHALKVFGKYGYDRTTVAMIAESAGISQGLMYRYFESKAALLRAIFARSMDDVRASMDWAVAGVTPAERIERFIRGSFEILREHREFWRLSYGVRMQASVLKELGGRVQAWTAEIERTIATFLRAAGVERADIEAAMLFALIDGVSQHYVLNPSGYPLEEIVERMVERLTVERLNGGAL